MNNNVKTWLSLVVRMSLFAAALLWPAGTWQWWEAWVLVGLWTIYGVVTVHYLLQHDPVLLAERMKFVPLHKEQKAWDKMLANGKKRAMGFLIMVKLFSEIMHAFQKSCIVTA